MELKTALLRITEIRQNVQNPYGVCRTCGPGAGVGPAAAGQTPGSPGLDSAVDRNCIQESTGQNLDRACRQDKEQGPLQKPAMDEESETLAILHL